MSPANPYDRRRGPRHPGTALAADTAGWAFSGTLDGPRASPVTFADVEALVVSARRAGYAEASTRGHEERREAQREAWEEGYQVGHEDGHVALLNDIDSTYGDRMRAAQRDALVLLARHEEDPRKVTKSDLATMLHETQAVLMEFLISHGHGF